MKLAEEGISDIWKIYEGKFDELGEESSEKKQDEELTVLS